MRFLAAVLGSVLLAGCAAPPLSDEEIGVLEGILTEVAQITHKHRELSQMSEDAERGRNFISFSKNLGQPGATPLMNPDYFWFKISLVDKPIEAMDLQPPVFTIFFPQFNKYLKLRITTTNRPLAGEIARIVQARALEDGGTDVRWGTERLPARGRRTGRF